MSRTTLRLDDELLTQAKELAGRTNRTLTSLIEDALREVLAREADHLDHSAKPLNLPTYGGGWIRPGVDIDNSAAILDLMEAADDPG